MPTNTEIIQAAVAAINNHDRAALMASWSPDGTERFPDATVHGSDAVADYFEETWTAIPDLHIDIVKIVEDGEDAFLRHVITGTHTGGPFKGIAPTGKRVEIPGIDHFTIKDSKITANFVVFDQMEIGRQLGLLPPDASAPDKALKAAFNGVLAVRKKITAAR